MKILLICGHGQGDPGACALGYKEAELVREYAPNLKALLDPYAEVTIYDTAKNMYKQIKAGVSFNFKAYDYVFELHFNAAAKHEEDGITTGTEIIVHPTEKGAGVEQAVLRNIAMLGFKNRGVKVRSDLQNCRVCKGKQGVSYALLETCFIDDPDDMKLYQAKKNEVVKAVADGIISGFSLKSSKEAVAHTPAPLQVQEPQFLESANDITWELNHAYFPIDDMERFVKTLDDAKEQNSSLYWGFYKLVNRIR